MLSLSGLHAFPLLLTLAGLADVAPTAAPTPGNSLTARLIGSNAAPQVARSSKDETADVFFHPLGFALILGWLPQHPPGLPPSYPSDPGDPKGPVDPPPSGGKPPPSGGKYSPPVKDTPEPATLISGMIGFGLLGLAGWRRKRR